MFDNLDLFRTAGAMAGHAAARQTVVSRNLANADTPGYRAQATLPFAEAYETSAGLRANRPGHMTGEAGAGTGRALRDTDPAPNGNSVSLELEMIEAAGIERESKRALAVYRHSLTVLRTIVSGR